MHCGRPLRIKQWGIFAILLFFSLTFYNCQEDPIEIPTDEEFTKSKLETLGKLLTPNVLANYDFLPEIPPYDTSVYWYVQTMYTQATSIMRLDKQSPPDNRWDQEREWEVFIIQDDDLQHAFTLPGGNLFITTGMLLSFEREHELYYLLTFEAGLMNESHMLDQMISTYNSLTIKNLIEGRATATGMTMADLAQDLPDLSYDEGVVEMTDKVTVKSICNTSILEPTGLNPSLSNPAFQNAAWFNSRPNYPGRPEAIIDFANDHVADCGHSVGVGNYRRFVLNVLE